MKEQLFITFLTRLLKQHEGLNLSIELTTRLSKAALTHAEAAMEVAVEFKRKPYQQ